MERVMIRNHASLEALWERGFGTGTLHKVPEVDGIILAQGERLFVIPPLSEEFCSDGAMEKLEQLGHNQSPGQIARASGDPSQVPGDRDESTSGETTGTGGQDGAQDAGEGASGDTSQTPAEGTGSGSGSDSGVNVNVGLEGLLGKKK